MKSILIVIVLSFISLFSFAQSEELYHRIELGDAGEAAKKLHEANLSLDYRIINGKLIAELNVSEIRLLDDAEIDYTVLIENVSDFYHKRNQGKDVNAIMDEFRNRIDFTVPENFDLGSMGGFCTWDEINVHLDNMHNLFPDLISQKQELPVHSVEGRPLFWVRISDNPGQNEEEPEVFYNSLIHAREPASMQQLLYFMYFLLENYNSDDEIQRLVDHTELYFIPCINPDGYIHNQLSFPEGGGMWRKNRQVNYDSSIGVDPNRNFGYKWGYDDYGSSPIPNSITYRGDSAFSTPEIRAIRDFAEDHAFNLVMNYHSYGNLLLHPWGYVSYLYPDDYDRIRKMSSLLTQKNHFNFGPPPKLLYLVNGDAADWFYGEDIAKPRSIAFTPEVGSGDDGFWPPVEQIIPQCQSCLEMNLKAAQLAGCYAFTKDAGPVNITAAEGYIKIELQRLGLSNKPFTLAVESLSDAFDTIAPPKLIDSLPVSSSICDSVFFRLRPGLIPGKEIVYRVKIENDAFVNVDTVVKIFGPATTIFEDSFDDDTNWDTDEWVLRDDSFVSPVFSVSNVAGSYYPNNNQSFIHLKDTILQNESDAVWVNFSAWWDLDGGRDYVEFVYSDDLGQSWKPLEGRYSSRIFNGLKYIHVYEGAQDSWIDEWILITGIKGIPVKLGFAFTSDNQLGRSGFYCDDFRVLTSNLETTVQQIQVDAGWTGISSWLLPVNDDIPGLFDENLNHVEFFSTNTRFFQPGNDESNLGSWKTADGYTILADEPFVLTLDGYPENYRRLHLEAGWNLIPVLSGGSVPVDALTTDPQGMISAIKDACGTAAWWPEKVVKELQVLQPGKSYWIRMKQDAWLIFE